MGRVTVNALVVRSSVTEQKRRIDTVSGFRVETPGNFLGSASVSTIAVPFHVGRNMDSLLSFPSSDGRQTRVFDLSGLVHELCESFEVESSARGVSIEADAPPHAMIQADRARLGQALESLLTIILAASPERTDIVLTTISDEDGVELEVAGGSSVFQEQLQSDVAIEDGTLVEARWRAAWSDIRLIAAEGGAQISMAECPEGGIACTIHFPHNRDEDAGSRRAA